MTHRHSTIVIMHQIILITMIIKDSVYDYGYGNNVTGPGGQQNQGSWDLDKDRMKAASKITSGPWKQRACYEGLSKSS